MVKGEETPQLVFKCYKQLKPVDAATMQDVRRRDSH